MLLKNEVGYECIIFIPVKVNEITFDGCGVKAEVVPVNGLGTVSVCVGDLLTLEQAKDYLDNQEREDRVDYAMKSFRNGYMRQRRAAFAALVDAECSEEEKSNLIEEYESLGKLTDRELQNEAEMILRKKFGAKIEEEDDND